ncbi:MAG TPA: head GIN domain-containing protein [Spirochaetia bacterium]|nr:head GIN domain-containing protein [Spirochaetia bacterium]
MSYAKRALVIVAIVIGLVVLISLEAGAGGAAEATSARAVSGFDTVSLDTSGELIITQGDSEGLEIVGSSDDLPYIVTEVQGGALRISREGPGPIFSVRNTVFRLRMKDISSLEADSSGSISVRRLRADSLRIHISSSGSISIDSLTAGSLEVQISSSGSLRVAGDVDRQDVVLSSSGSYAAGALSSRTAKVVASSSGTATVRVSDSLDANVSSSGDVRYYGNPPLVNGNATSSGRIVRQGG